MWVSVPWNSSLKTKRLELLNLITRYAPALGVKRSNVKVMALSNALVAWLCMLIRLLGFLVIISSIISK